MNQQPNDHSLRRITLPSGRSIEVVRFADGTLPPQGLHVCRACTCELVQPISWNEAADERWELTLECPNCWWTAEGIFSREQIHELEERLDDGLSEMLDDLKRLAHSNMADQIERFVG